MSAVVTGRRRGGLRLRRRVEAITASLEANGKSSRRLRGHVTGLSCRLRGMLRGLSSGQRGLTRTSYGLSRLGALRTRSGSGIRDCERRIELTACGLRGRIQCELTRTVINSVVQRFEARFRDLKGRTRDIFSSSLVGSVTRHNRSVFGYTVCLFTGCISLTAAFTRKRKNNKKKDSLP